MTFHGAAQDPVWDPHFTSINLPHDGGDRYAPGGVWEQLIDYTNSQVRASPERKSTNESSTDFTDWAPQPASTPKRRRPMDKRCIPQLLVNAQQVPPDIIDLCSLVSSTYDVPEEWVYDSASASRNASTMSAQAAWAEYPLSRILGHELADIVLSTRVHPQICLVCDLLYKGCATDLGSVYRILVTVRC